MIDRSMHGTCGENFENDHADSQLRLFVLIDSLFLLA